MDDEKESDLEKEKDGFEDEKKLEINKKQNNQLIFAVVLMVVVIVVIIATPFVRDNYVNKFEYNHLEFEKVKTGEVVMYHTKIPVVDSEMRILPYEWIFRNDPRELELIPVETPNKSISFLRQEMVYVSVEKEAPVCADNTLAIISILNFLDDFGNLNVDGAVADEEHANETGHPYVTCETHPDNTVIMFKSGDESAIKMPKENCYEIHYKGCEVNDVTEKFIFTILKKYMNIFDENIKIASSLDSEPLVI